MGIAPKELDIKGNARSTGCQEKAEEPMCGKTPKFITSWAYQDKQYALEAHPPTKLTTPSVIE